MSNDSTWIIVVTVAVIVAVVSITAILVAVALPQLSRIAADMRHHEARVHASNNDVLLELQRLFDGMLDDYRERTHDVDELVQELRRIERRLHARGGSGRGPVPDVERDLARALSNVGRAVDALSHFRPVSTRYVARRLDEVLHELRTIRERLEALEASTPGEPAQDSRETPEPSITGETQGQAGGEEAGASTPGEPAQDSRETPEPSSDETQGQEQDS